MQPRCFTYLLPALLTVACQPSTPREERGDDTALVDTAQDTFDTVGSTPDTTTPQDTTTAPDIGSPTPQSLPLGPDDVQVLGPVLAIDLVGSAIVIGSAIHLYVDSIDVAGTQGMIAHFESSGVQQPWRAGELVTDTMTTSPSALKLDGQPYLYWVQSNAINTPVTLLRQPLEFEAPQPIETLPAVSGVASTLSWPRWRALAEGRVALAFRDALSRPMLALSDDGVTFDAPVLVGPESGGALAAIGEFGDGSLAYTYQHPVGFEPMVSFVRRSVDGVVWSEPVRVSEASSNVHDTAMVLRGDGGLDLYYIYPAGPQGFVLFRRALMPDGRMGEEQRVTSDALGEPSKPEPTRLNESTVLLTWAEISRRDPIQGYPLEQRLTVAWITDEAPAPE